MTDLLLVFTFSLLLANPDSNTIRITTPDEVKLVLDKDYPGWTYPSPWEDWIIKLYRNTLNPFITSGDFDGDANIDYAVQLVHPDSSRKTKWRVIVALLKRVNGYEKVVLETHGYDHGSVDVILLTMKKGSAGEDLETDRSFNYPHDAISVGYSDKASHDYIWINGKFERITTGD